MASSFRYAVVFKRHKVFALMLFFAMFAFAGPEAHCVDFALSSRFSYGIDNGFHVLVRPLAYFGNVKSLESDKSLAYVPGIFLEIGYFRADMPNRSFRPDDSRYHRIGYDAVCVGLGFANLLVIDKSNSVSADVFANVSMGGEYSVYSSGVTSLGLSVGYGFHPNENLMFGPDVGFSYDLAGDKVGFVMTFGAAAAYVF